MIPILCFYIYKSNYYILSFLMWDEGRQGVIVSIGSLLLKLKKVPVKPEALPASRPASITSNASSETLCSLEKGKDTFSTTNRPNKLQKPMREPKPPNTQSYLPPQILGKVNYASIGAIKYVAQPVRRSAAAVGLAAKRDTSVPPLQVGNAAKHLTEKKQSLLGYRKEAQYRKDVETFKRYSQAKASKTPNSSDPKLV